MKNTIRIISLLLAAATLLPACNKAVPEIAEEEAEVSFALDLGGLQTKAYSDGTSATALQVLVYSVRDAGFKYLPNVSLLSERINGSTRVTLRLVKGESYHVVFWAQNPDGPYEVDPAGGTMTVSPAGLANAEARDAFYNTWDGKVSGSFRETVELRRPFAQINVMTTDEDWKAAVDNEIQFSGSSMTVTAPTMLNLHTGVASKPAEYKLSAAAIDVEDSHMSRHKHIAMNYILAGDRTTSEVRFSVYRDGSSAQLYDYTVANVPYERNFRTNIIGNIFGTDGVFNIIIVPEYQTPQNNVDF